MARHNDLTLENVLRTWRLMAPRSSLDMERARETAMEELAAIDESLPDLSIEKAIIIRLRADENSRHPRRQRTRQEKPAQHEREDI